MSFSNALPWWAKISAKIVLHRLPLPRAWWRALRIFRHGGMNRVQYSMGVVQHHLGLMGLDVNLAQKTVLELGPGDGVATAVIVAAYGGETILVDTGKYADQSVAKYRDLTAALREPKLQSVELQGCESIEDVLSVCSSTYLTNGLQSLRQIESGTVDIVFSHAVLEHVRHHEFVAVMQELRRIMRPSGVSSHRVDLRDHLGGGLNNLRFRNQVWESEIFAQSGFYTNRLRFKEMTQLFEHAGFSVEVRGVDRWHQVPLARKRMAQEFRVLSDEDLCISGFDVVLRPV